MTEKNEKNVLIVGKSREAKRIDIKRPRENSNSSIVIKIGKFLEDEVEDEEKVKKIGGKT